jgi:hypothetical protein
MSQLYTLQTGKTACSHHVQLEFSVHPDWTLECNCIGFHADCLQQCFVVLHVCFILHEQATDFHM